MKNIQVIDGAKNCVYDIFQTDEVSFNTIFVDGTNIAFIEDLVDRKNWEEISSILERLWSKRIPKKEVIGIHGTIFYELLEKKKYYPSLIDEEAINPNV